MRFTKLRLTGFKSFVDPTELLIREGLTERLIASPQVAACLPALEADVGAGRITPAATNPSNAPSTSSNVGAIICS